MTANPYSAYKENHINTSTPGMLLVLMFENAAKHLNIAIKAVNDKNIQESHDAIMQVQSIYTALNGFLDSRIPISANLSALYGYILNKLAEANIKKDAAALEEILGYTAEFRDTWREAEKKIHIDRGLAVAR